MQYYIIALLPVFSYYSFLESNISLAMVVVAVFSIYPVLSPKNIKITKDNKWYLLFILIIIINSIITYFVSKNVINIKSVIIICMYSSAMLAFKELIKDGPKLLHIYSNIAVFISCYLILQVFLYEVFGIMTPNKLPILKIVDGISFQEQNVFLNSAVGMRYSAIFGEPAHFANYVFPALFLKKRNRFNISESIIISIALVASTASIGMILVSLYWIKLIFNKIRNKNPLYGLTDVFKIIIVALIIIAILNSTHVIDRNINKIFSVIGANNSLNIRVIRGFYLFYIMPLDIKLIGVGWGNISKYISANKIITIFDGSLKDLSYMNSMAMILNSSGVIAFVLFIYSIIKKRNKMLVFGVLLVLLNASIMPSEIWLLYYILLENSNVIG